MKIAIMGYSGSGKSTLARELGALYHADVLHFDAVHFLPGWEVRGTEEKKKITEDFLNTHYDSCVRIPMRSEARSLNLSNAVAITVFEALRQLEFPGLLDHGSMQSK